MDGNVSYSPQQLLRISRNSLGLLNLSTLRDGKLTGHSCTGLLQMIPVSESGGGHWPHCARRTVDLRAWYGHGKRVSLGHIFGS